MLVAVAAGLGAAFGVVQMLIAVVSGTPEAYSAAAGYWALAGLLLPLVVAFVAERRRRDLGLWAGGALLLGGAMTASAPLIVLVAHGTWDAAVHYPGRVSGSEMPLAVFAWLAGIVAAALLVSGALVLGRRGRRGRDAEGPTA